MTPNISTTIANKQADQRVTMTNEVTRDSLKINQCVLVEDHSGNSKWTPDIILSRLGPMNYDVLVNNEVFKQNDDQILMSTGLTSSEAIDSEQAETDNSFDFPSSTDEHQSLSETDTSGACYLSRNHQPPDRLSYN